MRPSCEQQGGGGDLFDPGFIERPQVMGPILPRVLLGRSPKEDRHGVGWGWGYMPFSMVYYVCIGLCHTDTAGHTTAVHYLDIDHSKAVVTIMRRRARGIIRPQSYPSVSALS